MSYGLQERAWNMSSLDAHEEGETKTDLSLKALKIRSTSSSRWMAEASRLRRRSKSASDSTEAGVEDSAGVFEVDGSLDIARSINDGHGPTSTEGKLRFVFLPNPAMATTLQSLRRALRPHPYLNVSRLHQQLSISRCTHNAFRRKGMLSYRSLSTHTFPPPKSPRARVVSARELYAQRNRNLFMYTSAVVRSSPRRTISHV